MAQYTKAVLTDAGVQIARRMMDDDLLTMTFTGIASGDGAYSAGEVIKTRTALKSQKQFFPISSRKVTGDNVLRLKYIISNLNPDGTPLTTGYYVNEVGVYAQVDEETPVLYAIAVADEGTADYLPAYNELQPSTITMDWFVTVGNTANVSIEASAAAYALASDLTALEGELNDAVNELDTSKLDTNGDAADAKIGSSTTASGSYPIPAANDTLKVILGKIIKFFTDIKGAITGLSVSGRTITWTKANGQTGTLTTQDTTYGDATNAASGLLSAANFRSLFNRKSASDASYNTANAGKVWKCDSNGQPVWGADNNTTYSAGTGLTLNGTQFKHSNAVAAGTAGTSSATSAQNTVSVPYVTYDAQGHITAAGVHTHTINGMGAATASAAGKTGLVPQPVAGKNTYYLRGDATWQAPQNNLTTTAAGLVLDARQGKTLADKFTTATTGTGTLVNSSLDTSNTNIVNYVHYPSLHLCMVQFDIHLKAGINTNGVAKIATGLPKSALGGNSHVGTYAGQSSGIGQFLVDTSGVLWPWYFGSSIAGGHAYGAFVYVTQA